MNLDEILNGIADALELERELGTRVVELDRALLTAPADTPPRREDSPPPPQPLPTSSPVITPPQSAPQSAPLPLVFLHDRALSPKAVVMMAKIVTAMELTPETAPILFTGQRPEAEVTVVLGLKALRQWFPGSAGAPGQWIDPNGLKNVLVTYSPEHILRLGDPEKPSVKAVKREMWASLKGALQRMGGSR